MTCRTSLFTKAAKPDVLPGVKVYSVYRILRFLQGTFFGQRNFTVLKMLLSAEVSKKDSKIGIIVCVTMHVFDEN